MLKQLREVDKKLHRLKERCAIEDIDREMYEKFKPRLLEERKNIEQEQLKFKSGVSNLEKCVDEGITYTSKLAPL